MVADRLEPFGTTIFTRMSHLAAEHGAINLSQGFPDFEGPTALIEAVETALRSGENQYCRSQGHPALVTAISGNVERFYGLSYDPMREVACFHGATEAIAATLLGTLNPGDEVVLFEPFYDSYPACCALAGATPSYVTLRYPEFRIDRSRLEAAVNERTRAIVLNTPHNPTGRVFSRDELLIVADVAKAHDLWVLADEVYEHLTFDDAKHICIASLPGMRERTITISSAGKTFSFTGWKVGWCTGPEHLVSSAQAAHQFLTFCASSPIHAGVGAALPMVTDAYYDQLRADYRRRRSLLVKGLKQVGFDVVVPEGTYFVLAHFGKLSSLSDVEFSEWLIREHKVAAIPPSGFYLAEPEEGRRLLRFAFCKNEETIQSAVDNLKRWADREDPAV